MGVGHTPPVDQKRFEVDLADRLFAIAVDRTVIVVTHPEGPAGNSCHPARIALLHGHPTHGATSWPAIGQRVFPGDTTVDGSMLIAATRRTAR